MVVITDISFDSEVLQTSVTKPVIAVFSATWCGPCKQLMSLITQLEPELHNKYTFVKIDVEESPIVTNKYKIRSVPTTIIFSNNNIVTNKSGIFKTKNDLLNFIKDNT